MLRANPFGAEIVDSDFIINSHGLRCIRVGIPFLMDAVVNILHGVFVVERFAGNNPILGRMFGDVALFGRRKFVSAFRAFLIRCMNESQTLRTFFRRSVSVSGRSVRDRDHVHRAVAHDVAAIVQHEAILLACFRRQPRSASHHLNEKPRRIGRPQENHAVGIGRIEASGQNIDVAEKLQWRFRRSEQIRRN